MQGRLSPRSPGRLQAFPEAWPRELDIAAQLGFGFLEWLLLPADNPLETASGRREIQAVARETGVPVASVCAARFVTEPLHRLPETIGQAAEIGAVRVLIPLLEQSSLGTPEREAAAVATLASCAAVAERADINLALELDLPGAVCLRILERIDHPRVRACYDAGNATALGWDVAVDVDPLLSRLDEVHIKDRRVGGASVPLGTGDANFAGLFRSLRRGGYDGDVTLEHFFEIDPVGEARSALELVREHLRGSGF